MADMKFLDTLEEVLLERGFPLDIVQKALETAQAIDAVPLDSVNTTTEISSAPTEKERTVTNNV